MKYKVGDNVKIIAGDQKGSSGKIVKIYRAKNKALVEGINMVKKHNKPNSNNPKGGIVEKEAPIHISNISFVTKDGNATRVGYKIEDGNKVRISTKTKETI
jgi:large subunit ribosomal protein L24